MNQKIRALRVYTFVFIILIANALRSTFDGFSQMLMAIQDWQRWMNVGQGRYRHPASPISVLFMSLFSLVISWTLALFVWTVRSELAQRIRHSDELP